MSNHYTDAEFDAAWLACAKVRDAAPRLSNDAPSNDVVKAVLDVVAPAIAARALREAADDVLDTRGESKWLRARADGIEARP